MDVYLQSSWEDIAPEVTVHSVRVWMQLQDTSGYLTTHLPWLINLALFVCDVDQ